MSLAPAARGPAVIACSTCRHSREARTDGEGVHGGARMAAALRRAQAADTAFAGIAVEEMPCLFACEHFCTVHLRAPGRIGYVLGRFEPTEAAARAILEYAARHAQSTDGRVPYGDWPEGVKGHFLVRVPPEGQLAT